MTELAVQSAEAKRVVVELVMVMGLRVWWLWVWVCGGPILAVGLWWLWVVDFVVVVAPMVADLAWGSDGGFVLLWVWLP